MRDELAWDRGLAAMDLNNYVQYDYPAIAGILFEPESPEDLFLKKEHDTIVSDGYHNLSDEAKQVIDIVINTPQEMIALFRTPTGKEVKGKRCRQRIAVMLRRQWKDARFVANVMEEIEEFVKLF